MTTTHNYVFASCDPLSDVNSDEYRAMVAECAYQKADKRRFEPGHELEDWLEAEQEIKVLNFFRFQT